MVMPETMRPPAPPALPKGDKRKKRWMRPRSYRREFMRTHPGLADKLLAMERRKLRVFAWSRAAVACGLAALVLAAWVMLLRWR